MIRNKRLPKEKLEAWIDEFVGFRGDEAIRICLLYTSDAADE